MLYCILNIQISTVTIEKDKLKHLKSSRIFLLEMANLIVRYFAQLRYDGDSNGYVSQRYPNYDNEDVSFPNLDLFCQLNGWKPSKKGKDPTFSFLS